MSQAAQEKIEAFDELLNGLSVLFDPGTEVIDAESIECSTDEYEDLGNGVSARRLTGLDDVRKHHPDEIHAFPILAGIGRKDIRRMFFFEFTENSRMKRQCHPQKKHAYILRGQLKDEVSGQTWNAGELAIFRRMQRHIPHSSSGCLLLLIFT